MSRARYAPDLSRRFGTRREDPLNPGVPLPGEFNQDGRPMGTPRPAAPSALTRFQLSQPNRAAASPASPRALPAPAKDEFNRPTIPPPQLSAPAPVAASRAAMIPSHPDDRALLAETRARDAAARQPAPVSIPGGDPAARAFNGRTSTPEPGAPMTPRLAVNPDRARLDAEAARTGRVSYVPRGTPESPPVWSDTGVSRAPVPMLARAPSAPPAGDSGYIDESSARMHGQPAPVAPPVDRPNPMTPAPSPRRGFWLNPLSMMANGDAGAPSGPVDPLAAGQQARQDAGQLAGRLGHTLSHAPEYVTSGAIVPALNALAAPVNFAGGLMGRKDPLIPTLSAGYGRVSSPTMNPTQQPARPSPIAIGAPGQSTARPAQVAAAPDSPIAGFNPPIRMPSSIAPAAPITGATPTPAAPATSAEPWSVSQVPAGSPMPSYQEAQAMRRASMPSPAAPSLSAPTAPIANPFRMPSAFNVGDMMPPLLTGNKPKKRATPLWDQPANQY